MALDCAIPPRLPPVAADASTLALVVATPAQVAPPPPLYPPVLGDPTASVSDDAPPLPPKAEIAVALVWVNDDVPPFPPAILFGYPISATGMPPAPT